MSDEDRLTLRSLNKIKTVVDEPTVRESIICENNYAQN